MADRDDKDLIGRGEDEPPRPVEVHGLGGNRRRLELERRRAANARLDRRGFRRGGASRARLTFVQISDSHIGFHLPPNPDPRATLTEAIDKIKAMPTQPAFLVHTGDISHLSKEEEWDDADQVIKSANKQVFFLPGEHDVADADNGKAYLERYGKNTKGKGWYSFDHGRRAFHRPDQRVRISTRLQIRRPRQDRRRAARMAGEGCQRPSRRARRSC